MTHGGLFILLEGIDDERFVNSVFKPFLDKKYKWVKTYTYARKTQKEVCAFLRGIQNMNADYFFFKDMDFCPCITVSKQKATEKYQDLKETKIFVVVFEVESWYLAGLDNKKTKDFGLKIKQTDKITKEQFEDMIPKQFVSKVDFMQEILKEYSISKGKSRNRSLEYVSLKLGL